MYPVMLQIAVIIPKKTTGHLVIQIYESSVR